MFKNMRGLVTALLCVILTMLLGCARDEPLYSAGLVAQTKSETAGEADSAAEVNLAAAEDVDAAADEANGVSMSGETAADGTGQLDASEGVGTADSVGTSDFTAASTGSLGTLAGLDTGTESIQYPAEVQTEAVIGYVYVCGAVKDPGVYPVTADMRVCDAVALAGGFSSEADEEWLNQAAVVSDGQKLYIYTIEETGLMRASGMTAEGMNGSSETTDSGSTGSTGADNANGADAADTGSTTVPADGGSGSGSADGRVNLNTATRDELMTLPGIGESKADAIIAYRSEHGAFASIEEIQDISGIKSGVFSQIKDFITV